ncbi:BMP family ABC transporter substrate-binding protein [Propioniciclava tarda]|uniref:BMP family ABC transporter substrate-binding protein n=1 Tax=Propioniciclava tarda TaxID=433330 RepID=A0A4Q9KMN3_PROTD|nr:BMP family ABC transporter substrate-binding protein [Propioniciclava tarda]TBT95674.1 BMP family ABC transporter substrate-binding protein [Propioniciclava tarda]SMO46303.1 nucleoside-binding protein [Propioniciclava tarda]
MKAIRALALAAAAALALSGCAGGTAAAPAAECGTADAFCIGLVTDSGKVDDKSFNQSAWEGVQAAVKAIPGSQSKYVETTDTKDYAANIKQFTDKKYNVVVTVGFLMTEATQAAAKANPNVKFIGIDQFQDTAKVGEIANLAGLTFPEDQAGYAAGVLAAKLSKTKVLGQVLGMQIAPVEKFAKGFEAGAKSVASDIKVITVYHPAGDNAFTDPAWGAAEAQKQLDQKADVIFGAGGKTGNGALGQVAKASGAGESIFCIGVDTDQWNTVPEAQKCLVTSAMKLISEGTADQIKAIKGATFKGGNVTGKAGLAEYHAFDSKVPADVKDAVSKVVADLKSGALQTGVKLG